MIATRFRSVYWVGGVAAAALCCYLVSQRVAAERQTLARVEVEIVAGKRAIRSLNTEIGTRAGLNQIERWNVEVLSLQAPKPVQYLQNEVQLASLIQPVRPAMETAQVVQVAAAAPLRVPPQVTQASYSPDAVPESASAAVQKREAQAPKLARAEPVRVEPKAAKPSPKGQDEVRLAADRPRHAKDEVKLAHETPRHGSAEVKLAKAEPQRVKDEPKRARDEPKRAKAEVRFARDDTKRTKAEVKLAKADVGHETARIRPAIYVRPGGERQNVALLDERLLDGIARIAARERAGSKRDR